MACCNKRAKKVPTDTKFFKRALVEATKLKDVVLSDKTNTQILNYHRTAHQLYGGNMKSRPINKTFINSIVDLHNKIMKEIIKRKMKHSTPLKKL